MLDRIERFVLTYSTGVALALFAASFTGAVYGGIIRASEGLGIGGFRESAFYALTAVVSVLIVNQLIARSPRAVLLAVIGALSAGAGWFGFGGALGHVYPGRDWGLGIFGLASVLAVALIFVWVRGAFSDSDNA